MSSTDKSIQFKWILSPHRDLFFYIGSAGIGWLYIALVYFLGRHLAKPMTDALTQINLGNLQLVLTLELLVYASWAFILDAPHVFATLARTYFDPDEWQVRRRELNLSWLWFLAGPLAVAFPFFINIFMPLSKDTLVLGSVAFLVFFRLWAYYHVVRQHFGFLSLYRRKANELPNTLDSKIDNWAFNIFMYAPLVAFISADWYASTGFPPLGFEKKIIGNFTLGTFVHPLSLALLATSLVFYIFWQLRKVTKKEVLNGPKLLFLFSIVPLHFAVFSNPILALFVVPIVTAGHNLQYHQIVWAYGRIKYLNADSNRYKWAQKIFSHFAYYALAGLLFTFLFYRGPWVDFLKSKSAHFIDGLMPNAASVFGSETTFGAIVITWFITGFAMQHYYLDAKIWRVGRDKAVAKTLGIS